MIIAVSIILGMVPIISPTFFHIMPQVLRPIFTDPIMMTSITAVVLNAYFNRTSGAAASHDAMRAAQQAETM